MLGVFDHFEGHAVLGRVAGIEVLNLCIDFARNVVGQGVHADHRRATDGF